MTLVATICTFQNTMAKLKHADNYNDYLCIVNHVLQLVGAFSFGMHQLSEEGAG